MTSDLALPAVLAQLQSRLGDPSSSAEDLLQALRALQRLGFPKTDMQIHLERARAVNDATTKDPQLEEHCLLALDMLLGEAGDLSLSWDTREMARIYVPRAVDEASLRASTEYALTPSDMLPTRPGDSAPAPVIALALDQILAAERAFEYVPMRADFFRVPKDAFTTRPAALLALPDRLILEALAGSIEGELTTALPTGVLWPRGRDPGDATEFKQVPLSWEVDYIVKADIERFYESIDHSLLAMILAGSLDARSHTTHAIESFLSAVMGSPVGLPQGPLGSDLFASAYLLLIDKRLVEVGWTFVRYADDYFIAADSMADGRAKIEELEGYLSEHHLQLSGPKTSIMRRSTYEQGLSSPAPAISELKRQLRDQLERNLLESEDADDVIALLSEAGAEEQLLWDVIYHGTKSMEDAIDELGDGLDPSTAMLYLAYLNEIDRQLSAGDLPEDMASVERLAKECIAYMAVWRRREPLLTIGRLLSWFPGLGQVASTYYRIVEEQPVVEVDPVLVLLLASGELPDWTTAWLCQAVRGRSSEMSSSLVTEMHRLAQSPSAGPLTRASALWALAKHRSLTRATFTMVLEQASDPVKAEIFFAAVSDPEAYGWFVAPSSWALMPVKE